MIRVLFRDTIIYTIPMVISRGIFLFLVPLYTRVLSPSDYGAMDLLIVFGSLVNLTVALEVSQGVARYYTDEKSENSKIAYASSAYWFTLFCYTVFLIICFVFATFLSSLVIGKAGLENIFRLGVAYIWFNGLFYFFQNQFRWELRSKEYAIVGLLSSLVTAGSSIVLAYIWRWGLPGVLTGMLLGSAAGCFYSFWNLRATLRPRFELGRLRDMLVFSAPLVPSGIAVFVSMYIDRIMINRFLSLEEVGIYGVAFRLAGSIQLIMAGFQAALTPLILTHYRDIDTPRQVATIFRVFLFLALMGFMILSMFSSEILLLMTTSTYYRASNMMIFLVPAVILSQMYIFAPGIGIAKKTYIILWINLVGAVLIVGLNLLFIPALGISGAAIAKVIGYGGVFCAYMIFSQALYKVPHNWSLIVSMTVVVVASTVVGMNIEFNAIGDILSKVIVIGLMPIIFFRVGFFSKEEIASGISIVNKRLHLLRGQGRTGSDDH